jgi:GNAT superfamily N-acetyltransferase
MIQVRTATRADARFIIESQCAMALETEALTLDPDTVHKGVHAVFAEPAHQVTGAPTASQSPHSGRGFYLVAENAGAPAGCMLVLHEWSDWRNREVWWLHSVYVLPASRKTGVFRALHAEVERLGRARGVAGLRLYVDRRNTDAQAVYRALGMTDEHYELYERMF